MTLCLIAISYERKNIRELRSFTRLSVHGRTNSFSFFFFNAKIKKIGFYRLPDCRSPLRYWDSSSRFFAALSIGGFSLTDRADRSRRKVRVSGITEKKFYDIEVATMHKLRASFGCNMFRRFLLSSSSSSPPHLPMLLYKLKAVTKRWIGVFPRWRDRLNTFLGIEC